MFVSNQDYRNYAAVRKEYRTKVIAKCEGGWHLFDTNDEYHQWRNQK